LLLVFNNAPMGCFSESGKAANAGKSLMTMTILAVFADALTLTALA
jgi:hypothetical protein